MRAEDFLQSSSETLTEVLRAFAEQALPIAFHCDVFDRYHSFVRFSLTHLFRGQDALAERLARCVTPGAAYHVPGLGPGFWSRLAGLAESESPVLWCPAVERGLLALGILTTLASERAERIASVYAGASWIRKTAPDLTSEDITDFLERVSRMTSRELPPSAPEEVAFGWSVGPEVIRQAIREVRIRLPLRKRLRQPPPEQLGQLQSFINAGEYELAFDVFRSSEPSGTWESTLTRLDDAYSAALPLSERARLWCDISATLRERFRVHPAELSDVIAQLGVSEPSPITKEFGGFCDDTFAFLAELASSNTREWMAANRERYQFAVREPMLELCQSVAGQYIRPIVNREFTWDLETDARPGRALTSICKNDYGRGVPYQPVQWVTYYRRKHSSKSADAQFFVRISADGVRFGFHLGRSARDAGSQFRRNIQIYGDTVFRSLAPATLLNDYRFWTGDDLSSEIVVRSAADLRAWATSKTIAAGLSFCPAEATLRSDTLPGEVLLTFDRLLPLFVCAAETDPLPLLTRRSGTAEVESHYDPQSFHRETYLSEVWLDRVLTLLRLKKQLVLQGVPGTGKTHVARCLARLLTHDRPESTRLVQFHPAFSYEEFVEGIRVRTTVTDGRNDVSYPVEDGVLCEFAALAAARPSEPHVLIIDELNRGNLPQIFGELLFLLEYREQAITLPYSKRAFRLPANLFVIATMNALDRSAGSLDQALRRRFSFIDMPADPAILASWLEQSCPASDIDETFGSEVVRIFEELNAKLAHDLGPGKQIGHSFFMVPHLSREKFSAIWEHHVRPMLLDYLGGREASLRQYTPDFLLPMKSRRPKTTGNKPRA